MDKGLFSLQTQHSVEVCIITSRLACEYKSTHSPFVVVFFSIKFRLKMLNVSISSLDPTHCLWIGVLAMLSSAVAVFDWRLSLGVYPMLKQGIIYITSLVKCCNDSYFVTVVPTWNPATGTGEHGSVWGGSLSSAAHSIWHRLLRVCTMQRRLMLKRISSSSIGIRVLAYNGINHFHRCLNVWLEPV
jgi:hypothetical protein